MATIPPITIQRTPSEQINVHTPLSYARTVDDYARVTHEQSLYPGQSFEALARFLQSPRHRQSSSPGAANRIPSSRTQGLQPAKTDPVNADDTFATHYQLAPERRAEGKHLCTPEELEHVAQSCSHEKMGQLLILRGYPSPSWLCSVGASYDVDPEFFGRHLAFLTTSSDDSHQDGASKMPSASANIFHFRLPTIGSYTGPVHTRSAQTLVGLRDMVQASMNLYRHKLRIGAGWKTGDSIVRQYNVHDIDQFSIEQAVTVYFSRLRHSSDHWIVIIFMDAGADPGTCEWPEAASTPRHLPFPHQKRSLALKPDLWKDEEEASSTYKVQWRTPSPLAQSASRLHKRYGRFLRHEMMCQDPFYTLNELFSVLTSAEAQVLDVIELGFARDSWQASQDENLKDSTHSRQTTHAQDNLVHARRMLEARISNLSSVLGFVERHQRSSDLHSTWPQCADARQQRECDAAAKALQLDFEHLQRRALILYSRCESAMTLAMNRASIAEARRSLQQGQTLSNFTALAFVFIPLTATATIFGMNFQELGTGKLKIWLFFAVSVSLSFMCFMFLYGGWGKCWQVVRKVYAEDTSDASLLLNTHAKLPTHPQAFT